MTRSFVRFNLNDLVRVRLTDFGRKLHRQQFRELNANVPLTADLKYTPPKEDDDGWSEWQMWYLMQTFGEHIGPCKEAPFEINIEIQQSH